MATRVRDYNIYGRKKLPRNKWGLLDQNTDSTESSVFGGGLGSGSSSAVGGTMVSISEFVGATATEDGVSGLVPAPLAGQDQYFLQGNKNWTYIPAFKWLKEWPEGEGLEKRGLGIDGDFNVSNTLSTLNLRVGGAAHFWSLIIDEVRANGGQVLVSPSLFHVDWVGSLVTYNTITLTNENLKTLLTNRADIYNAVKTNNITEFRARRLYQRNDDGSKRIINEVWPGDMLRCKTFNIEENGKYDNVSNTDYWSFVLDTGLGTYIDGDGIERDAFYIDLVYSAKDGNGKIYPIDTTFYMSGQSAAIPDSYSEVSNILELKKVSQQVLTGDYAGQEEQLDGQELIDVQNAVIQIRGISDQVQGITGKYSTNSIDRNNLVQANKILAFASDGTLPNDADNMIQLIATGKLLNNNPQTPSELGMNILSKSAAAVIGTDIDKAEGSLRIDKNDRIDITLPEGTITEREFIAAEDLKDKDGKVVIPKDGIVGKDRVLPNDWTLVDIPKVDRVFEVVEAGQELPTTIVPANESEINGETNETDNGTSRDIDKTIDYNSLTEWKFGYGVFSCHIGDNLACLGHLWNNDRQNAIVLSSTTPIDPDLTPPSMAQYNNIDRFGKSISNFRLTCISASGNEFTGSFLVNYNNKYIDVNDRINMFMTDITTGLETVGIHLSGEESTITLVGSVNLRQHSADSYDTLNVFDNLNTKRVEITPLKIPARSSVESGIVDGTKHTFKGVDATKNATSGYIDFTEGWHDWEYYKRYYLNNYSISFTISTSLGYLQQESYLDLRNLALTLYAFTYFNGNKYISDHGDGTQQKVSVLTCKIKRDGIVVQTLDLKNNPGLIITGLDKDLININMNNAIVDNYPVPANGVYSVEINVTFIVHAHAYTKGRFKAKIKNPYYKINTGINGSIYSYVEKTPSGAQKDAYGRNIYSDMTSAKMTIGNNGLVFSGNNSRYFYTATDGYDFKWDEYGITIDSTNGVRINGGLFNLPSAVNTGLPLWADVVICPTGSYYVILPDATKYGIGRHLTIMGPDGVRVSAYNTQRIIKQNKGSVSSETSIPFGNSLLTNGYCMLLVCTGAGWIIAN